MNKLEINTIEKIAKTVILISAILGMIFIIFIYYSELSGKSISIEGNYLIFGLLINIGILILIYMSVRGFIKAYKEAERK
ncbi:MAG: hypothetical protein GX302_00160 [Methanosarcina flavescens]|jgi:hypothetical protein|uniref:Uncharacterized protein n=1 Tax=Methanosarcina flavescens TaxID=1715806 RepID=A0A7K4ARH2_9EURY|nr:hypothetical protein [Methanosarcina flavescens]